MAYREVMSTLYKRGLNPSLLYPARLCIMTKDEGRQYFTSVGDHDGRPLLTTIQMYNRLLKNKSMFYGHGEKTGKLLANVLKGKRTKQLTTSIHTENGDVRC